MLETIDLDAIGSHGYAFQIETTYRAKRAGFSVVELPIRFADRERGQLEDEPGDRRRGDLAGAAAQVAATVDAVRSVDDATFDQEVLRSERPVIVDFTAPWCGPCRAIAPALEELARESEIDLVSIDVDENPETAARFAVLSLPTVILFTGGEPRETVYGARPKKHFAKAFAEYL